MTKYSKTGEPRYCKTCEERLEFRQGKAGYCKPCKAVYDRERKVLKRRSYHKFLSGISCQACGETHPHCLEVHHLYKGAKRYDSSRAQSACYNIEDINSGKATVLCSSCHSIFHGHFGGKQAPFPDQTIQETVYIIQSSRRIFK